MQVGDVIQIEHDSRPGVGIVMALRDGRAYLHLTVRPAEPWQSPLTGGIVPGGCPLTYCLWLPVDDVTTGTSGLRA